MNGTLFRCRLISAPDTVTAATIPVITNGGRASYTAAQARRKDYLSLRSADTERAKVYAAGTADIVSPGHNPYEKIDSVENRDAYDLSQKQRALERKVRHLKAEVAGRGEALKDCPADAKDQYQQDYDKAVDKLKRATHKYNDFCAQNGLRRQYDRLENAQYTRMMRRQ